MAAILFRPQCVHWDIGWDADGLLLLNHWGRMTHICTRKLDQHSQHLLYLCYNRNFVSKHVSEYREFIEICIFEIWSELHFSHYNHVIVGAMASQITSVSIVYFTVCSNTAQRKHQRSASLTFVKGIHRWPVNFPHEGPETQKMFPFGDVIMCNYFHMCRLFNSTRSNEEDEFFYTREMNQSNFKNFKMLTSCNDWNDVMNKSTCSDAFDVF